MVMVGSRVPRERMGSRHLGGSGRARTPRDRPLTGTAAILAATVGRAPHARRYGNSTTTLKNHMVGRAVLGEPPSAGTSTHGPSSGSAPFSTACISAPVQPPAQWTRCEKRHYRYCILSSHTCRTNRSNQVIYPRNGLVHCLKHRQISTQRII